MIYLQISDAFLKPVNGDTLEQAAQAALQHEDVSPDYDLSIVIEDDSHLQQLNNEFLGIDAPTDVLSFPSEEEKPDPETGHVYLGDIIISYPRALEQSTTAGHPVENEMQLLVVHGVLHLLGYDHYEPEEKEEMWSVQAEILRSLGVTLMRLPE